MTDIASLGLEIRSDGVVVATDRLGNFRKEAGLAEAAAGSLKRIATMGLAALAAGFAAFGVGIGAAVKRMEEMRKLTAQVDQALKNSGNSARTSAGEIEAWADKLEARTGRAAEEIMGVSANLASFGFSRQAFFRSLELADDMSAAWGGDLKQNLEGLARALAEPEKGLAMLTKRGITFSDEQKKMIGNFIEMNDLAGAQGVVFDALEAQVKGVAQAGFGGLTKSLATMSKAWEDAFEDLVRGDGQASDLTDTLGDLAGTISSPEFIGAVMGFGNMIIQVINGIAQVAVGAAKAFSDFMELVNAPGGGVSNMLTRTAPLDRRDLGIMQDQLTAKQGVLDKSSDFWGRDAVVKEVAELRQAIENRSNPGSMNVNGVFATLNSPTYGSPEEMWKGLSPGTMFGQTEFNPYEGMQLGGADKDKASAKSAEAYADLTRGSREFIESQALEAHALGMTEEAANRLRYEQDMLNEAANDNLALGPAQRAEIAGLAEEMAAAEEATRRLTEIYSAGKEIFSSFFGDIQSGIEDGKSLWQSLGDAAVNALNSIASKAMEMATNGIWDMLFGAVMGGFGGGGGGWGVQGGFSGFKGTFGIPGMATGGTVGRGGLSWVGEQGPELLSLPQGAQVIPNGPSMAMAANGNGSNDNRPHFSPTFNINGSGLSQAEMQRAIQDALDHYDRFQAPQTFNRVQNDPTARG